MSGNRRITIAEYLDPMARRDREIQEAGLDIQAARVRLQGDIAAAQFQRDDARHADEMMARRVEIEQEERHHADRMAIMNHTNAIREKQIAVVEGRNAAEIALGRDRLAFDEQRTLLDAQVSREAALIQSRTAVTIATIQQEGAKEIALLGHETSLAVAELQADRATQLAQLTHAQAMTLAREESHLRTMEVAGRTPYEAISSTLRKSEDTNRALSGGMAAIFVERQKARLAAYLEDQQEQHREKSHRRQMEAEGQKEAHRTNERAHERTMAEYSARFARVGFTRDELIAAGFSAAEAALIVSRLIDGINSREREEEDAAVFAKFDEWYKTAKS